jgi:hypothetical protein
VSTNWENNFEDMVSKIGNLVGQGELQAREFLGDEEYDKLKYLIDRNNELSLRKDEAQGNYMAALAAMHIAASFTLIFGCLLGLAWSLYAWFS